MEEDILLDIRGFSNLGYLNLSYKTWVVFSVLCRKIKIINDGTATHTTRKYLMKEHVLHCWHPGREATVFALPIRFHPLNNMFFYVFVVILLMYIYFIFIMILLYLDSI